jgi:putative ABC transport system permease protein
MNYFGLGLRNVWRNRRRSIVTLLAVAFGFASIAIFGGYVHNVYEGLMQQAIQGELLGHLTINKRGLETMGRIKPEKYLFSKDDIAKIEGIIKTDPHVALITPRLALSGIISNGRASTIFVAEGVVPADVKAIKGDFQRRMAGDLDPKNPIGIAIGDGLAEILGLKKGDTAAMLVSTLTGQSNALDVEIADTFDTGNPQTRDKFVYMPISLAQSLYDVEGQADRLIVLLDDTSQTNAVRDLLAPKLAAAGFDVEIRTWDDISVFYRSVKGLFTMIFAFIFGIVIIVVMMSIVNAMSMTVVERTREIGALRAMGLRRGSVVRLFTTEAAVLVGLGCAIGLGLTLLVRLGVNHSGIQYVPPNSSNRVKLLVDVDAGKMLLAFAVISVLGALSALLPARRAARQPIIDSLGHV